MTKTTFTKINDEGNDALYLVESGDDSFFIRRVDEQTTRYMYSELTIRKRSYWQAANTIEDFKYSGCTGEKTRKECARLFLLCPDSRAARRI